MIYIIYHHIYSIYIHIYDIHIHMKYILVTTGVGDKEMGGREDVM